MIPMNEINLMQMLDDIELCLLAISILSDAILEREKDCSNIGILISDSARSVEQILIEVRQLLDCDKRGVVLEC